MSSTGEVYPASGSSTLEAPYSDNAWTTPEYIVSDDGNTANITPANYDNGDYSYVLKGYNFDFSAIPDGSTIDGVTCRINAWYATGEGSGSIVLLQLLDTSNAKVGDNQCATPEALTTTTSTVITKGSSSSTWGNSLTAAWVKNSNFGVALVIQATANNADVFVDYITLEIEYTAGVADLSIDVSDGLTLADSPAVDPLLLVGVEVTDGLTLADTPIAEVTIDVTASDDLTVGESATVSVEELPAEDLEIDVTDSIAVSDDVPRLVEYITVGEDVTVTMSDLVIDASDGLTVADTATTTPLVLADVSVTDGLTVADNATIIPLVLGDISVSDDLTVGDTANVVVEVEGVYSINVSDGLTLGDSADITPLVLGDVTTSDGLTLGDSAALDIPINAIASDGLTIGDAAIITPLVLEDIDVNDGLTISDTPIVQIPVEGVLYIDVSDGLTLGDSSDITPLVLGNVSVSDGLSVADSASMAVGITITAVDGLILGDTITITPLLLGSIAVTDALVIGDTATVTYGGLPVITTWTLNERDLSWTLEDRDLTWTLAERDLTWTLEDR